MSAAKNNSPRTATGPQTIEPYCFRLPMQRPPGQTDPYFGCNRSLWNQLVLRTKTNGRNPPVKSVVRKDPKAKRGIRFVIYSSAKAYFEKLAQDQAA